MSVGHAVFEAVVKIYLFFGAIATCGALYFGVGLEKALMIGALWPLVFAG